MGLGRLLPLAPLLQASARTPRAPHSHGTRPSLEPRYEAQRLVRLMLFTTTMAKTSQAFTAQLDPSPLVSNDLHARATRILRTQKSMFDTRKTVESAVTSGARCWSCHATLEQDALFCGMCGGRARPRRSLIGDVIDGLYVVEDKLAEGSTATIYRARYLPSGSALALKVLHPELGYDHRAVERFRREGKCLARLRNRHTVAVYDHGETADGTLYIAMELLRAEGLDVRVRTQGAMPWRAALSILRAVCDSLAEAHALGIVHRDLSTANVLVDEGDLVKVIDFGLAKLRPEDSDEELTSTGHAIGTLSYAAPEQLAGRTCDQRADLYAIGVIGCELMLGRLPLRGPSSISLPGDLPREVAVLLRRCLASDPSTRFATATDLAAAIDRILTPPDPVAVAVAAPPAPRRRVFPHTSAFELLPPRIVIDAPPDPAFLARGSSPEVTPVSQRSARWKLWAAALVVCGIGLGTAVAGCV